MWSYPCMSLHWKVKNISTYGVIRQTHAMLQCLHVHFIRSRFLVKTFIHSQYIQIPSRFPAHKVLAESTDSYMRVRSPSENRLSSTLFYIKSGLGPSMRVWLGQSLVTLPGTLQRLCVCSNTDTLKTSSTFQHFCLKTHCNTVLQERNPLQKQFRCTFYGVIQ